MSVAFCNDGFVSAAKRTPRSYGHAKQQSTHLACTLTLPEQSYALCTLFKIHWILVSYRLITGIKTRKSSRVFNIMILGLDMTKLLLDHRVIKVRKPMRDCSILMLTLLCFLVASVSCRMLVTMARFPFLRSEAINAAISQSPLTVNKSRPIISRLCGLHCVCSVMAARSSACNITETIC